MLIQDSPQMVLQMDPACLTVAVMHKRLQPCTCAGEANCFLTLAHFHFFFLAANVIAYVNFRRANSKAAAQHGAGHGILLY